MSQRIKKLILLSGDIFLLYISFFASLLIRYQNFSFLYDIKTELLIFHFSFIYFFWLLILFIFSFYDLSWPKNIIKNLFSFFFLSIIFTVIYFYFFSSELVTPKTILFLHVLTFVVLFLLWRLFLLFLFKSKKEKIVIAGFCPELKELCRQAHFFYEITAFYDPNNSFPSSWDKSTYGIVNNLKDLKNIIKKENITTLVYFKKEIIEENFSQISLNMNYLNFIDFYENINKKIPIEILDNTWLIDHVAKTKKKTYETLKRTIDIFFALFFGLLIVILFPFIFLAIKVDSAGSIFYKQKRVGKNKNVFFLYKFRTMIEKAEKHGPQWAQKNDQRITRIGRILRTFHLDELPQFYNILKGDLSLIGPRPERPEFVIELEKEIPYYNFRHLIKPGLTGWAQIKYDYGRSQEQAKEKLKYEFYYIKNYSVFLDLEIILKTIQKIFIY